MNLLLIASLFIADTVVYPLPPEKVDPSTVAVTNEFRGAWWNKPYHERYRILVDFDFDGHDDMLLSEPMADFGTGGGCWTAYHWTNGLYQAVGSFGAHYAAAAQPALWRWPGARLFTTLHALVQCRALRTFRANALHVHNASRLNKGRNRPTLMPEASIGSLNRQVRPRVICGTFHPSAEMVEYATW